MPTAIFVDAGFFLKRFRRVYQDRDQNDPGMVARALHEMALGHLTQRGDTDRKDLYRIFVYDCAPLREGIDFILDPMWTNIADDLHEHVDGLRSTSPRPRAAMDA